MKILFFGDSITDMGRKRDSDGHIYSYGNGYVFLVGSELFTKEPGKYEIINRGISGNRIVDLYARVKADVWYEKPDVLSILIGVNDIWHDLKEKPNGTEIDRWAKMYRILIEDTKKALPDTKIILCEPFVLEGINSQGEGRWEYFEGIRDYAKIVESLAKEYDLYFVPLQEKFDNIAKKYDSSYFLYDGIHPHIAGASVIAKEWLKVFEKSILGL